jgi:hypothetical protein
MLGFVRNRLSPRKLRLFAAESWRRIANLLPGRWPHQAIETLARAADGEYTSADDRASMRLSLLRALPEGGGTADDLTHLFRMLAEEIDYQDGLHAVRATTGLADGAAERVVQSAFLRDVFGNLFAPVRVEPRWRTSDAVGLARAIYHDRTFDRLPTLADALMDAGCEDEEIINHCRSGGRHVRGCWVVDLVLGKE